jgi:hypothetical protein
MSTIMQRQRNKAAKKRTRSERRSVRDSDGREAEDREQRGHNVEARADNESQTKHEVENQKSRKLE